MLGNRGMPRITLERQLELLHEELSAAMPEQREQYQGLLEAAGALKAGRLRILTSEEFREMARRFQEATADELPGRLARTGELIVSAVCDESEGITEAVTSLFSWLTDRERFSTAWICEVRKTGEMVRAALAGRACVRTCGVDD